MYVLIVFGRPGCKAFIHPAYHVVPVLIYVYMLPFWLKAKLAFSPTQSNMVRLAPGIALPPPAAALRPGFS